mmetsp:Transcript_7854/g.18832  ORF Transcript_7854/g.18832 Transcript_7854/m.18832 type:complete len:150 (-) Transcript_7854:2435-2884(-)
MRSPTGFSELLVVNKGLQTNLVCRGYRRCNQADADFPKDAAAALDTTLRQAVMSSLSRLRFFIATPWNAKANASIRAAEAPAAAMKPQEAVALGIAWATKIEDSAVSMSRRRRRSWVLPHSISTDSLICTIEVRSWCPIQNNSAGHRMD